MSAEPQEDDVPDMVTAAETGIPERTLLGFIFRAKLSDVLGGVDRKTGVLWITNDWRLWELQERLGVASLRPKP